DDSRSEEDEPLCKIDEEDDNVGKIRPDEDELLLAKIQQDENERRAKDQLEEDEQLAKAIQLSLAIDSPHRHGNDSLSQPSPHVFPPGFR
ncbi:protein DA1-related 1-like, partial [Trifolium medium]|nr:protein DA1-related 1-like [Trifolium medium]